MHAFFAIVSFFVMVGATIPYIADVVSGRAITARSSRIMFVILMVVTLFQQRALGSGWSLTIIVSEAISALMLLGSGLKYGVGGLTRLDITCYLLLVMDIVVWVVTKNSFLALHLSILADFVAFWPTVYKTVKNPQSETALYYVAGVVAPLLAIAAETQRSYNTLAFPIYLAAGNSLEVLLIWGLYSRLVKSTVAADLLVQ